MPITIILRLNQSNGQTNSYYKCTEPTNRTIDHLVEISFSNGINNILRSKLCSCSEELNPNTFELGIFLRFFPFHSGESLKRENEINEKYRGVKYCIVCRVK